MSFHCFPPSLARSAVLLLLLAASPPALVVGEQHRVAVQPSAAVRDSEHRTSLRITIWYPAKAGQPLQSIDVPPGAPVFHIGAVAPNAPFADKIRHPLVLVSHGFGGSARMMGWLALPLAAHGYVVVAVDHPGSNGVDQPTPSGSVLWWDRADDLKVALSTVLTDPQFSKHVDGRRVGVAGFSIGGLTALVAGGARIDPARMIEFCRNHPVDGTCKPQLEFGLSLKDAVATLASTSLAKERARAGEDHSIPSVKAVLALAPVVQPLTPGSLRRIGKPVLIIAGENDTVASPQTQALVAKGLIPGSRVMLLPGVAHYSFLGACTGEAIKIAPVCRDATAQDFAHRSAIDAAIQIFDRNLM